MCELCCMAVALYKNCGLWELQCVEVALWGSCSVGKLWCVVVVVWGGHHCGGFIACEGCSGFQTLTHCFFGVFYLFRG